MTLLNKIFISLGLLALFCCLGLIIYQQFQLSNQQKIIQSQIIEQKQLADGIVRSQNQMVSKGELEDFIKKNDLNLKIIQDDLKSFHGEVKAANLVKTSSLPQKGSQIPSTSSGIPNPQEKPVVPEPILKFQQNIKLSEDFGNIKVPIGEVGFSAWEEKPWSLNLLPREYKLTNVIGTDENGRIYTYNQFKINIENKEYLLPISSETKQEVPTSKFYWWNPRLFLGVEGGLNLKSTQGEIFPVVGVGIMSYGQYRNQPDWSFLHLGIGYGAISKTTQFSLTPASYNLGKHLPLMNNLYIGPGLAMGANQEATFFLGIRAGL